MILQNERQTERNLTDTIRTTPPKQSDIELAIQYKQPRHEQQIILQYCDDSKTCSFSNKTKHCQVLLTLITDVVIILTVGLYLTDSRRFADENKELGEERVNCQEVVIKMQVCPCSIRQ